jgi:hypothetical protein
MSDYTTEWGNVFNKAAIAFANDIKAIKKDNMADGKALEAMLDGVQRPLGVLGALAAIDKISLAAGSDKDRAALPANIKLFKAALTKLQSEVKKYTAELAETEKAKLTRTDKNGYRLPVPLKEVCPASYRQVKILKSDVVAIVARAENALDSAEKTGKIAKIQAEKDKAKDKVKGTDDKANAKIGDIQNEAAMKTMLLKFAPAFKSSMLKGAAVIQKIKASPDVATYNAQMNDGGRDISQNLVNIQKLKADAKFKGTSLAKKLPDPGPLAKAILPFANGDMRNLPKTASADDVKKALADFTVLYKKIADQYKDVIAGKIK